MKELFRRLFHSKFLAFEIIGASFFVNILFLASPIFVIQILSRYIGYGFDGTLYTLTSGMLIALILGVAFTIIRTRMCSVVSIEHDLNIQGMVLDGLANIKTSALDRIPQARIQEVMAAPAIIQSAYDAQRIASVLDMPFFLLFVLAVFLLSPSLAILTLLAVIATVCLGAMNMRNAKRSDMILREELVQHRGGVNSAIQGMETVRAFRGGSFLRSLWDRQLSTIMDHRQTMIGQGSKSIAFMQGLSSLLKVSVYALGAKQVVMGDLTVGALIGVSILSAKAFQIASGFMQTASQINKAGDALKMIHEFSDMPRENTSGTGIKKFTGKLEFVDVAMAYPGAIGPLFESLTCTVEAGSIVGLIGSNGAGKTTLCKMIVGLLEPGRGQMLADGVDLRQLAPGWWRKQVVYLPQEPTFLNGTYKDNITMLNPSVDAKVLNEIVRLSDLRKHLDGSASGMDTVMHDGGRSLPLGIRKRLALARALVGQGKIAVFDEPTEGLDIEGAEAVLNAMNKLSQNGATIFVVSKDPKILQGVSTIIDLNMKPKPRIGVVQKQQVPDMDNQMMP